jgi:hypothetical protein
MANILEYFHLNLFTFDLVRSFVKTCRFRFSVCPFLVLIKFNQFCSLSTRRNVWPHCLTLLAPVNQRTVKARQTTSRLRLSVSHSSTALRQREFALLRVQIAHRFRRAPATKPESMATRLPTFHLTQSPIDLARSLVKTSRFRSSEWPTRVLNKSNQVPL